MPEPTPPEEPNRPLALVACAAAADAADATRPANEWSYSRHRLLSACERAVYWQYWGSRGGYRSDAPAAARRAWALKGLVSVPSLLGTVVHNAAREVVAAIRDRRTPPTFDVLYAEARRAMNDVWRWSQPGEIDRFWNWPTSYHAFREIVYAGRLEQDQIEQARIKLGSCLRHLVGSPLLHDVRACAPHQVRLGGSGPDRVALGGGVTVWAALDLLYRHGDPGTAGGECRHACGGPCWCVVDHKTGRPSPAADVLQLAVYCIAIEAQGYPPTDGVYFGRVIYLLSGTEAWFVITEEDMAHARAVIRADVALQRAFYVDWARGVLKPRSSFALARELRTCEACNFLALCREELRSQARPDGVSEPGGATVRVGASPGTAALSSLKRHPM